MNKEEIINTIDQNNKIIAEFMNLKQVMWPNPFGKPYLVWVQEEFNEDFTDIEDYSEKSTFQFGNTFPLCEKITYHYSWSFLIPVVKKCIENEIYWSEQTNQLHDGLLFVNIEEVWEACVEFIKEYNEKQKI